MAAQDAANFENNPVAGAGSNWTPINPMTQQPGPAMGAIQSGGAASPAAEAAENFYLSQAKERYGYIDSVFTTVDELKLLLIDAIQKNLSLELFQQKIKNNHIYDIKVKSKACYFFIHKINLFAIMFITL